MIQLFRTPLPALAVAAIAGAALACSAPDATETAASAAAEVELAPEFELASLGGELVDSSIYEGKVLLLEFWATWCGPCVAQARILEPLHRDFAARGVEFVAINLGEDAITVSEYVERTPFPYQVLLDPQDSLSSRLGIYALPTVMIVDRAGRIAYRQPGLSSGETLRRALEELLG